MTKQTAAAVSYYAAENNVLWNPKKILFVASECTPYIATGGLAEVIGSLSKALAKNDSYDVRVVLPLYTDIPKEWRKELRFLGSVNVPLAWRNQYCGVFSCGKDNVTYYFLDNEYYFKRPGCYGYYDDGERFAFFSRAVMEIMPLIDFYPDILHCHDWQAAAAALYLKTIYCRRAEYERMKAIFTIHNIEYQGKFALDTLEDLFGISYEHVNLVEYDGCINLMKGAIECSEMFSTVSPRYAEEIKQRFYAHGLAPIVIRNEGKLRGILNGIDVDSYNASTDTKIYSNFDLLSLDKKKINKTELQRFLHLPIREDVPMIAMITRLVSHKGLDLVQVILEDLLKKDVQVVLLGTGDKRYEEYFERVAYENAGKMSAVIAFNGDLSRRIYAAADLFLMPSKSEPCGLSQMIASRYATLSLVRETGGLYDSIKPYDRGGIGFTFKEYNAYDMLFAIHEALALYEKDKAQWRELMEKTITTDFSWAQSAKQYEEMYLDLLRF